MVDNMSIDAVLNVINNAVVAVRTANEVVENFREAKAVIMTDTTEAEVDAALAALRKEYDTLHERVQNKLRGTSS